MELPLGQHPLDGMRDVWVEVVYGAVPRLLALRNDDEGPEMLAEVVEPPPDGVMFRIFEFRIRGVWNNRFSTVGEIIT